MDLTMERLPLSLENFTQVHDGSLYVDGMERVRLVYGVRPRCNNAANSFR